MTDSFSVQIAGIIQHTSTDVLCYDISYMTFAESRTILSNFTIVVLSIISDHGTIHQFIDLNKLISEYDVCPSDWDDIITLYTEHHNEKVWSTLFAYTVVPKTQYYMIDGKHLSRQTPFSSNMVDRVTTFSLDHHNYVTGSYLNKKAPYIRNVKSRIRTMPDLVFTKTSKGVIDFENIIVSIDGNIGYPEYDITTDELYVKNGAYFLRGTNGPDQNIVFMDFSGLVQKGSSLIHKYFHECAPELMIGEGENVEIYNNNLGATETLLNRDTAWWKQVSTTFNFDVPLTGVPINNSVEYVPLVCFGGRLFFPMIDNLKYKQYIRVDTNKTQTMYVSISLQLDLDLLSRIVASNLQHAGIFLGNSSFYHVAVTYALSNIFTANASNIPTSTDEWRAIAYLCKADIPFVTLIPVDKTFSISKINPIMNLHDGEMIFPANSDGILVMRQTKEITDYNVRKYSDNTLIETAPCKALYLSTRGQAVSHMNRSKGPVTQINGSADIESFFPKNATITYSAIDGDCYVVRSHEGVIIAKSSVTSQAVPYTNANLVWTLYETKIEIPDSMRYHDIVSEQKTDLVVDGRNILQTGVNIKNINDCYMLDIIFAGANSTLVEQPDTTDPNKNPERPVHTIEYMRIADPIKKGTNQ